VAAQARCLSPDKYQDPLSVITRPEVSPIVLDQTAARVQRLR
jgi:hypothetical protein